MVLIFHYHILGWVRISVYYYYFLITLVLIDPKGQKQKLKTEEKLEQLNLRSG